MKVYLGCPQHALVNGALGDLGDSCLLVAPKTPVYFRSDAVDWNTFLTKHCLLPASLGTLSERLVFAMARACERVLKRESYFGKVRHMPRFHQQLVHQLVRWGMDALTPDLLEKGGRLAATRFDDTETDLREEWLRKTEELAALWRAWREELNKLELVDPAEQWWQAVAALRELSSPAPLKVLLIGFTDFTAVELEILKALDARMELALALLYDRANPERFAPSQRLLARLQQQMSHETVSLASDESPHDPHTTIFSTPNPLTEVESVAREILSLHREGVPFSSIRVLVRQPAGLIEYLDTFFTRYGIPYTAEVSLPLLRSRTVQSVLEGLRLLVGMRTGAEFLAWLAQPRFGLDANAMRLLHALRPQNAPSDRWLVNAHTRHAHTATVGEILQKLVALRETLRTDFYSGLEGLTLLFHEAGVPAPDFEKLLELAQAHAETLQAMPLTQAVEWLERLCTGADYTRAYGSREGVLVLPMEHADLMRGEVVFVLQVLEGVVPRRHPDDPFLREEERLALREALLPLEPRLYLPTRSEYQTGEPMLFYRACAAASQRLYLTYPRTQNDSEALPSFYLQQIPHAETRLYRVEQFTPEAPLHPYDRLLQNGLEYAEPTSILRSQQHRQRVANVNREFSVSELETLARCPFQHLCRYILKVRPPRRGLQLTDIGTAVHRTLYRALREERTPADPQAWAERMQAILQELLNDDPFDLTHWQLQVLEAYATRLLTLFAQREPRYQQQFQLRPAKLEWAFGTATAESDDEYERVASGASDSPQPARYRLRNGLEIRICGVIDRIDWSQDGVAMVIDYKLGATPSKPDLVEARTLQGLLYADVVRRARNVQHLVLAYDHLTAGRRVRFVTYEQTLIQRFRAGEWEGTPSNCVITMMEREWQDAFQKLRTELEFLIERLQQVGITPTPGTHCKTCAYADLCRQAQK